MRLLPQSLLAERFRLVLHRETKDEPIYNLVVAKDGPELGGSARNKDAGVPA